MCDKVPNKVRRIGFQKTFLSIGVVLCFPWGIFSLELPRKCDMSISGKTCFVSLGENGEICFASFGGFFSETGGDRAKYSSCLHANIRVLSTSDSPPSL